MSKSTTVSVRIDPTLKKNIEQIFSQLGLTTAQALTLFLKQVELHNGLPFDVRLPEHAHPLPLAEMKTAVADLLFIAGLQEAIDDLHYADNEPQNIGVDS